MGTTLFVVKTEKRVHSGNQKKNTFYVNKGVDLFSEKIDLGDSDEKAELHAKKQLHQKISENGFQYDAKETLEPKTGTVEKFS